jgi:hypothetical protein
VPRRRAPPFGDQPLVPQRAILLVQRDQLAAGSGAGRAAGIGEEHEREQSGDLAILREESVHHARQPDRLGGQIGAMQVWADAARVPSLNSK